MSDDEFLDLLTDENDPLTFKGESVNIKLLCCFDEPTQYSARMGEGCEDRQHDAIANAMDQSASLDAIVKIVNTNTSKDVYNYKGYKIIDDGKDYISDHKPVKVMFDGGFDLISYNLEGLCRKSLDDPMFVERIKRFENKMLGEFQKGFIMCCQEMVLQQPDSLKQLSDTEAKVTELIKRKVPSCASINDGFTGAVFYDSSVWKIVNKIIIKRKGSRKQSNAYKFKSGDRELWVVNVHLKALLSTSIRPSYRVTDPIKTHVDELSNIISAVYSDNIGFKTPVFLCGDYNNPEDKVTLVESAITNIDKSQPKTTPKPPVQKPDEPQGTGLIGYLFGY